MTEEQKKELQDMLGLLSRFSRPTDATKDIVKSGSRRVFKDGPEISEDTDYDFIMMDTSDNRVLLTSIGFDDKYGGSLTKSGYGDDYSTAIFVRKFTYESPYEESLEMPIQIVLKTPESFPLFKHFWSTMSNNKEIFRELIWKSYPVTPDLVDAQYKGIPEYPNTPDKIRERIDHWIRYVIPTFFKD